MKKPGFATCLLYSTLFLFSCQPSPGGESSTTSGFDTVQDLPTALTMGLEAHGGLQNWNKYKQLSFQVSSKQVPETHTIDLRSRKVLITTDTSFSMGFDGENVWVSPTLKAYPGSSARFYHNLVFYFFSLPFVMADPGTQHSPMEDVTFNGVDYSRVKITFGEEVGDSPEDQYILWFRKDNQQLGMINYSVTYFNRENADKFSAIVYEEWQQANDLKVPLQWSHYRWQNDSLGEKRSTLRIENVSFSEEKPVEALFHMPAGGEIEPIPN